MIQKVFGIRDVKAKAFLQPFFSVTVDSAIRAFGDAVKDNAQFAKHPEDYILYELATFDDVAGDFVPLEKIHMLGVGTDFVSSVSAVPVRMDVPVGVANGS